MSFLQFLGYYMLANLINSLLYTFLDFGIKKFAERRLKNAIQSGKVRMVTLDELYEMQNKDEKKSWN